MAQQDQINALISRLQNVQTQLSTEIAQDAADKAAAANVPPPVDLTALTNEVASVEAQVAAALPPVPDAPAPAPAAAAAPPADAPAAQAPAADADAG